MAAFFHDQSVTIFALKKMADEFQNLKVVHNAILFAHHHEYGKTVLEHGKPRKLLNFIHDTHGF